MQDDTTKFDYVFYEQFATNFHNQTTITLKLFTMTVTVVAGYGYVYGNYLYKHALHFEALLAFSFLIVSLTLAFTLTLICTLAHSFRRDQYIINKIRDKYYKDQNNIFKSDFYHHDKYFDEINTIKRDYICLKKPWGKLLQGFRWMPNYYNHAFVIIYILYIIIFLSYLLHPKRNCTFNSDIDVYAILAIAIYAFLVWLISRSVKVYKKKIETTYNNEKLKQTD